MSQQGAGAGRGGGLIGTRGPGETQLEVDRRRILRRISKLEHDLVGVSKVRDTQRKQRRRAERWLGVHLAPDDVDQRVERGGEVREDLGFVHRGHGGARFVDPVEIEQEEDPRSLRGGIAGPRLHDGGELRDRRDVVLLGRLVHRDDVEQRRVRAIPREPRVRRLPRRPSRHR